MNPKHCIHRHPIKLAKIYGMYNEVHYLRYVGKTKNTLDDRLKNHLKEALSKSETHKSRGIRLMLANGFSPTIELITEVPEYKWQAVERIYIKHFHDLGYDLWNEAEGGAGCPTGPTGRRNRKPPWNKGKKTGPLSLKTRRKQSASHKGRKYKPMSSEGKQNIRVASVGKHSLPTKQWWAKRKEAQNKVQLLLHKKYGRIRDKAKMKPSVTV